MACAICSTRRPRRYCLGVRGDICSLCCGEQREITVSCPLDCEYLREAHLHEKTTPPKREELPNRDVDISEKFLTRHEAYLAYLGRALVSMVLQAPELIDYDVREALEAAIRTHRTMQSGLVYQSLPANPLAANLCRSLLEASEAFLRAEFDELGMHRTPASAGLHIFVFLQHMELSFNNGRRRGRAFIDALRNFYPVSTGSSIEDSARDSRSLIVP